MKTTVLSYKTLKLEMGEASPVLDLVLSQAEIIGQGQFSEGIVWWVSASGGVGFLNMEPQRRTVVGQGTKISEIPTFSLGNSK